uniref:TBC1 domain family member 23 n=1 Tax=Corethrella appendiculata TaxID=1370023 RepID=U5EYH8_9DIPT
MDDNTWLIELESALLDECSVNEIGQICRGRTIPESLRPDVWQVCLNVRDKLDQLSQFNEIYDLPFQSILRKDVEQFVDNLGNDDEDKVSVVSDIESILTFYCKNRNLKYETNNGWIELLLPLLSLKLIRSETYNLFESIRDTYIPKRCVKNGNVFHVFRLLILYHDPELCTILDTKRITPDQYAMSWFSSLFASTCTLPVVLLMWDLYFQQTDPFLVFFLSLTMLINARDQIIAIQNKSKEEIVKFLTVMPCALESDDVIDFCSLAQYYSTKTPQSFKTDMLQTLFGIQSSTVEGNVLSQALCLPVSVYELVENSSLESAASNPDGVRFFLVDCRPAEQYNSGHLSTAFHLDSDLMLQEPAAFQTAVQGLLRSQQHSIEVNSSAGGEHLCFLGSGRMDEDIYTHMVVASFLQKNTQYVSLLTGGYAAIHDYFGDHMVDCLEDHDPIKCLVCSKNQIQYGKNNNNNNNNSSDVNLRKSINNNNPSTSTSTTTSNANNKYDKRQSSTDLFSKLSAVMKTKSAEVKGKLFDYIANPNVGGAMHNNQYSRNESSNLNIHHASASDKNGKRYRNVAPVFSIDEDHDEPDFNTENYEIGETSQDENWDKSNEIISIQSYIKDKDVIKSFKCQEVHINGSMYDSYLIVTNTHMIVVREIENKKDKGKIIVRRPLQSIVKITAKKRHRNLITFKYGVPDGDTLIITDMDRLLIPNASEATKIISNHILKQL